jgi:hypothetical protein
MRIGVQALCEVVVFGYVLAECCEVGNCSWR